MTFYLYYAASDLYPALANARLANLEGIMWVLHQEIVSQCPRSNNVNRVLRYVVTVKNPYEFFNATQRQFGPLTNFSAVTSASTENGFVVGCQDQSTKGSQSANYDGPTLYSLPGGVNLGGECAAPDGEKACTWKATYAGEVRIDDISGIIDDYSFCANGQVEYDPTTDTGNGTKFWNFRNNATWNQRRVQFVKELFQMKYPHYPVSIGEPNCDSGAR